MFGGRCPGAGGTEPTIAEMLSDPIVRTLMAADRIDPAELESELRNIARMISMRRDDRSFRS